MGEPIMCITDQDVDGLMDFCERIRQFGFK